jgi:tetratricopeptide (TPR) repeat protein
LVGIASLPVSASDFWDEVRTPGLGAYRAEVRRARRALESRHWRDALEAARNATEAVPGRAVAHALEARALGELGQPEAFGRAAKRALELDARVFDDPELGADVARIAAESGQHALAARILERVLGRMPITWRRYELYVLYGDMLLNLGPPHLREAILAYREGLRVNRSLRVRAALGLALALRRAGERLEAHDVARQVAGRGRVDALISALPVPPAEKAARRAVALDAIGDLAGARRAWREASHGEHWTAHAQRELRRLDGEAGTGPAR